MSSDPSSVESEQHQRKRLRKGTRSCWECKRVTTCRGHRCSRPFLGKRRKIRCQLSSEDVPICAGCVARGTKCLSQDYPEEEISTGNNQIRSRLGRMEQLLETLVAKVSSFEGDEKIMTPESLGTDEILPPESTNTTCGNNIQETAPLMALFDNSALGRREIDPSQAPTPASQCASAKSSLSSCKTPRLERIRQTLLELLPSQSDIDLIFKISSSWLSIHAFSLHGLDGVIPATYDVSEIAKAPLISIARSLLYLASCLQQIDPGFEKSRLNLYPSADARMERYVSTVQSLVTCDEELVSSIEGLDCLILQSSYHSNAGNPRRAWLTLRKALNIGQLMGLHLPSCTIPGGRQTWAHIVQGDRYLALLLGLPAGCKDILCGPEETFQNTTRPADQYFGEKMFDLAGRIIDRNQNEQAHTYTTTQDIDEAFENLAAEMPTSWWNVPKNIPQDHSQAAVALFDRLMFQIIYYQFVALLHLPFMIRAATERRYEYSKFSCMKSSREMVGRYLALRETTYRTFCCRVIDFGAFTSTVTLFLGLLEPSSGNDSRDKLQRQADRRMIEMVLHSMEKLERPGNDLVAKQSASAIRSLLAVDSQSGPRTGNLKLTIPYFGTISIVRPRAPQSSIEAAPSIPPVQTNESGHNAIPKCPHADGSQFPCDEFANPPVISFKSSQFSSSTTDQFSVEGWDIPDTDNMFFDSLLNQDLTMMNLPPHQGQEATGW